VCKGETSAPDVGQIFPISGRLHPPSCGGEYFFSFIPSKKIAYLPENKNSRLLMKYSKLLFSLRPVSGHGPLWTRHPRLIKLMPLSLQTPDHFLLPPDNFIHFYFLLQFLTAPVQALKNCPRRSLFNHSDHFVIALPNI